MNIEKRLLEKILLKHNLEYDPSKRVGKIQFDEKNNYHFIYYGNKRLPFDSSWLDGNYDYMIPTSTMENNNAVLIGVVGGFQLFLTQSGDYYYQVINTPQIPNYNLSNLNEVEYKIFQELLPNAKSLIDELVWQDVAEWKNKHSLEDIFINDDGTTDLYLMSQLSDPKFGCSFHQNRVHSKSGNSTGYPTISQAKIDGYQFPNCRHTMRPFYIGYDKIPTSLDYTLYDRSGRKEQIKNSEKIRNRQKTLSRIDPKKDKQLYLKKMKEIEEIKKQGYLKDKIY